MILESYPECFTALRGGRVDAVTTDNVLLFGMQQQDPANFKLTGGQFTFEPYGIGIAKGNAALDRGRQRDAGALGLRRQLRQDPRLVAEGASAERLAHVVRRVAGEGRRAVCDAVPDPESRPPLTGLRWSVLIDHAGALLSGLLITIEVSLLAFVFSFAIGVIVATMRVTPQRLIAGLGTAYVEFVRNVPLLVQIFFFYFGLPSIGIRLDGFWSGVCGLSIYTGAFFAEAIRSGILSVPRGQLEAAQAAGLSYVQAMRLIVLPQALRVTIPPIGNTTLNMIKNSSLVSTVSVADILGTANLLGGRTFAYTELLIGAAALYLIITLPTALGINLLERRLTAR